MKVLQIRIKTLINLRNPYSGWKLTLSFLTVPSHPSNLCSHLSHSLSTEIEISNYSFSFFLIAASISYLSEVIPTKPLSLINLRNPYSGWKLTLSFLTVPSHPSNLCSHLSHSLSTEIEISNYSFSFFLIAASISYLSEVIPTKPLSGINTLMTSLTKTTEAELNGILPSPSLLRLIKMAWEP